MISKVVIGDKCSAVTITKSRVVKAEDGWAIEEGPNGIHVSKDALRVLLPWSSVDYVVDGLAEE
jgi:hypothetical protein